MRKDKRANPLHRPTCGIMKAVQQELDMMHSKGFHPSIVIFEREIPRGDGKSVFDFELKVVHPPSKLAEYIADKISTSITEAIGESDEVLSNTEEPPKVN